MDKTLDKVVAKFSKLRQEAVAKGVNNETIKNVFMDFKSPDDGDSSEKTSKSETSGLKSGPIRQLFKQRPDRRKTSNIFTRNIFKIVFVLGIVSAFILYLYKEDVIEFLEIRTSRCAIENNGFVQEISRPPVKCGMCNGLTEVPIEHDMSSEVFRRKYAYSGIPVLIKGATANWSAMDSFSFHFFKTLYTETEGALDTVDDQGQFFPYKTDFETLGEVFNISDARANFNDGEEPWYIGWSNCHREVQEVLRKHYQRPYFLPADSESSPIDWIFMGGPGPGAFIHLDYVERPSWQAQISGKKTWTLIPAPECEAVCHNMNVTVHKGDIFVIDTNQWYHATHIHPGEISITIGSEYD